MFKEDSTVVKQLVTPIGMSKDVTFNGSGELDNGWTVSVMHDLTDAAGMG